MDVGRDARVIIEEEVARSLEAMICLNGEGKGGSVEWKRCFLSFVGVSLLGRIMKKGLLVCSEEGFRKGV